MKILFLGLLYNKEEEKKILSRSTCGLQGAVNTFQWNLITGFDEILEIPIKLLTSLPVGSYPRYYNQLFIASKTWSHIDGSIDREIGYVNLVGLKQMIRQHLFYQEVSHWCEENKEEDLFLITYSLYLPYLKVLADIKKKHKNVNTCIIIPDLPNAFGFMPQDHSIKKIVQKYIEKLIYKFAKTADSYVLLTKEMVNRLDIKDKPYVIVEGICEPKPLQTKSEATDNSIIILYAGTLHQRFGIDKLITAFQNISQDNYQLWLCGVGDYQAEIEKAAKEDQRIKYYGYVTADAIHTMLHQATLLINPRPNEEEYTKYSFPSKTMEYMVSGIPVLMFKLDGIPEEYDNYLYYIKENTIDSIKEAILEICQKSKDELEARGKETYHFVTQNKSGKIQAKKILDILQMTAIKAKLQSENKVPSILQINITCQYGSTGSIVENLHNHLLEKGFQSYIAYSALKSNLKGSFKIENKIENYLRRALNRYFGRKYAHSTFGTLRLIKNIKRLRPDIIHLHNIQQNSVHFPMLLKFLSNYRAPVVYTLHDCWSFTGGCYHFTELGCDGYQTGCMYCKLDRKQRDICNKTTGKLYEEKNNALHALSKLRIICVSNWLKSCAEKSFMKDLPLQVIYNGIDTDLFKPLVSDKRAKLGVADEEFIILGVASNWDNKKGLDTFIQLAQILTSPYRIVLVGITPMSCPANIIAVQRTDNRHELVELYNCADVFFNASKEETFGLAAAEAMACGTPVIAYNSTACGEVVENDTGILLESFKIEELHTALDDIRKNGKMKYKEHCVDKIKRRFSKEEMLKQYINVYKEIYNFLAYSPDKHRL
ncbi:MAG: glycosyltransferase [Herbinix sp.]|nr:glycosyltransferase [Herbinix sp.]